MTMESDLVTLLKTACPRVFPDVAPAGTARPYLTWQGIGGQTARYTENAAANKRNTMVQIDAWSATRAEALTLIRQAEDLLCASTAFVVDPLGEALSTYEEDTQLYGCIQRFSIWAAR